MRRRFAWTAACIVSTAGALFAAGAASADPSIDATIVQTIAASTPPEIIGSSSAIVNGNVGENSSGAVGMNVASGAQNMQSNAIVLSDRALGSVHASSNQTITGLAAATGGPAVASVGGRAFAGVAGQAALNVASGIGNQQTNTIIVGH